MSFKPPVVPRILARFDSKRPGTTLVVTAGIHGNEPAGIYAIKQVIAKLNQSKQWLAGTVLFVSGNREALARGVRFIKHDLNRRWSKSATQELCSRSISQCTHEDREQRELLDLFLNLEQQAHGPLVFLDLHTTSGPSLPFVCFGDTLENRNISFSLPISAILGLEEIIADALLSWVSNRGHVGLAVEAGQHHDPETAVRHEAAIWLILAAVGCLSEDVPFSLSDYQRQLTQASKGAPKIVDILYRYVVQPEERFVMVPGYESFQRVIAGQVLAYNQHGPIVSKESGILLMPRYQGQGEDGFFLAREVSKSWLDLSQWLRTHNIDRWVQYLPHVHPIPSQPYRIRIQPSFVKPERMRDLLHLCGYRQEKSSSADSLIFAKRHAERLPPNAYHLPLTL
jgi:hypothetical protein